MHNSTIHNTQSWWPALLFLQVQGFQGSFLTNFQGFQGISSPLSFYSLTLSLYFWVYFAKFWKFLMYFPKFRDFCRWWDSNLLSTKRPWSEHQRLNHSAIESQLQMEFKITYKHGIYSKPYPGAKSLTMGKLPSLTLPDPNWNDPFLYPGNLTLLPIPSIIT